jgi:CRP/FNR family transcriptional regulator, cyclic AMP receptor protein
MKTLTDLLSAQSFFKDLTPEQLQTLADTARYRRFKPGELIFHDGNLANRFYVILEGKVALEAQANNGRLALLQLNQAGDILGWSWMFDERIRKLQARALTPTEVVFFYGDRLRQQCDKDPVLGYELFRRVAEVMMARLQTTRELLLAQPSLIPTETADWRPGEH